MSLSLLIALVVSCGRINPIPVAPACLKMQIRKCLNLQILTSSLQIFKSKKAKESGEVRFEVGVQNGDFFTSIGWFTVCEGLFQVHFYYSKAEKKTERAMNLPPTGSHPKCLQ